MKCNRCGGMMVFERFYHEDEQLWAWRCVHCGEYADPVIWENRRFQETGLKEDMK